MKVGMLWFDDDTKRTLPEKIVRAATYYEDKYAVKPNMCYVHPDMVEGEAPSLNGLELRTAKQVRHDHFWIGVEDSKPQSPDRRAA